MLTDNISIESQFRQDGMLTSPNRMTERADFNMNLHRELDKLEEMLLESGPRVAGRTMINEEKICRQIDQVRISIPESIARAEEILQYKQEIIGEADQYAEEVEAATQMRAVKMLEESTIVRQAELEASQLRRRVQEECDEMRMQTLNEINQMRRQAQKEWDTIRHQVNTEAEDMQRGADEYSDRILGSLEGQLIEMIKIVQNGRKEIRP